MSSLDVSSVHGACMDFPASSLTSSRGMVRVVSMFASMRQEKSAALGFVSKSGAIAFPAYWQNIASSSTMTSFTASSSSPSG